MTQLIKTAALTVDFIEDSHELLAQGALSMMVQPVLNKINDRLRHEKPAKVRENDLVVSTWLPPIPGGPFQRLILNEAKIAMGRYMPQTVSIEVTTECGCQCEHCTVKDSEGQMEKDVIKRVIDQSLDMGACIITFTEGDPLLREDIFDLVRYVDKNRAVVNLFTPGIEMTQERALALKEAGLYNLLVGVCSTDPSVHDRVRGLEGAYEKAVDAIATGINAGLLVTMSTHLTPERVDEIPRLYDLAGRLGVHELSLWEGIPRTEEQRLSQIDREKILRFYRTFNSMPGKPRVFASTYFEGEMLGCMAGRRWLHVCADGSVKGCPYMQEEYGNVHDKPLKAIWSDMRRSGQFDGFNGSCPAQELFVSDEGA